MDCNQLTRCEAEVMDIVWSCEPVTVQDVVNRIERDLAYTTVMTTLKILEEKGFVERGKKRGRAYLYHSIVTQESVRRSMVADLTERLFGGSVSSLLLSMVKSNEVSSDDLAELRLTIADLESTEVQRHSC